MKPKQMLVWLLVGGMIVVPGCTMPSAELVCPGSDLVAPSLSSPPNFSSLGAVTTALLGWDYRGVAYPYPAPAPTPRTEYACHPAKYRISLSTGPLFTDELGAEVPGGTTGGGFWRTGALQSGKTYRWSVAAVSHDVDGPPSRPRYFTIGAYCEAASLRAPMLFAPANGSTVATLTPVLLYDSVTTCAPSGYQIQYSQDATFATTATTFGGGGYAYYGYPTTLPELENCATYYWRVAAWRGTDSIAGPYSDTWSFKVQLPASLCLGIAPVPPIATLPPAEIPGQPPGLIDVPWQVILNANCRIGPGTAYNESGYAPVGYMATIEGRNEDGSWFRLKDPNGRSCWVSRVALVVPENWEAKKVLAYPTAPAPTQEVPVPSQDCAQYATLKACQSHPGCGWDGQTQSCRNQ